jgi:hypothetical protein
MILIRYFVAITLRVMKLRRDGPLHSSHAILVQSDFLESEALAMDAVGSLAMG